MKRSFPIPTDKRKIAKTHRDNFYRLNVLVEKINPANCRVEFNCPFYSTDTSSCRNQCKNKHFRRAIEAFITLRHYANPWRYVEDGKLPAALWHKSGFARAEELSRRVGFDVYGRFTVSTKESLRMVRVATKEAWKMRAEYEERIIRGEAV